MPENKMEPGSVGWIDLTVPDAPALRDFYQAVVGWKSEGLTMTDSGESYQDFVMQIPANGKGVTGICHARGENASVPPVWLVYFSVANLDESMSKCTEQGGKVIHGPRSMGKARFCVIEDPVGARAALFDPGPAEEES